MSTAIFDFTHGYGITMTNVSEFTPQGLPDLLIKDIPPQSRHADLVVKRPEIYYGELTRTPAVVNSREKEFDYPKGEGNVYIRFSGTGGVQLTNLWRKLLYGWKFDGLRLFLSGYPTASSRKRTPETRCLKRLVYRNVPPPRGRQEREIDLRAPNSST